MRRNPTDKVCLIKQDSDIRFANIGSIVEDDKIIVLNASLVIEEGDVLERKRPGPIIEKYQILDVGYREGNNCGGHRSHYQCKVKKILKNQSPLASRSVTSPYVSDTRIAELTEIESNDFELSKLIALCHELASAAASESHYSVALLVRTIIDHIPPIFSCNKFSEVANNYPGTKSFQQTAANLNSSCRKIADGHLHTHVRKSEVLVNSVQVNFSQDLDVVLAEIVRTLK